MSYGSAYVSGHDFSCAATATKQSLGFSPCGIFLGRLGRTQALFPIPSTLRGQSQHRDVVVLPKIDGRLSRLRGGGPGCKQKLDAIEAK